MLYSVLMLGEKMQSDAALSGIVSLALLYLILG